VTGSQRPLYLWTLTGILFLYAVIIVLGETDAGGPIRLALLAFLVWNAARLRSGDRARRIALAVGAGAVVVSLVAGALASPRVVGGVVGACSVTLILIAIGTIVDTLRVRFVIDESTVLGVLCIYLLFALFFAGLHQMFAAFSHNYLNGTVDPPTPSDLLYFSVITLSTVGFGDITPIGEVARAVTVVEALTGQLYLVSVVAGVVGGWRRKGS
jgi:hypothetical protein